MQRKGTHMDEIGNPRDIVLSDKAREVLLRTLAVSSLAEVLDRDYGEITPENDVVPEQVEKYSRHFRGSVRLSRGLFATASEAAARIGKAKALDLP